MAPRYMLVTADDFGIGVETSRGILDLAARGVVTSTVLLVNSPYAEESVRIWKALGCPVELGWHPCLTLDAPVLSPGRVPSLVDADGRFQPLGSLLKKLLRGQVQASEIEAELQAQYDRFREMVGHAPMNVNAHHHVHIFRPVGEILGRILAAQSRQPFVRRVVESRRTLALVPGARIKRAVLSRFGRRASGTPFPGNDRLIGVTNPPFVHHPKFFTRWVSRCTGRMVELTCHPGYLDAAIDGRDGTLADGQLHRRAAELERLRDPSFFRAAHAAGFTLVNAAGLTQSLGGVPLKQAA
ncbi:carbohydrate deacetylase [Limnoglobus roseus]|uniref:ChbG/HpnK family deacetylase n=1 Tax=Limnoglobus roseus TaxID=2598579 RepID=A0A5C1A700_9BACT|nr:ChbG/HpnK family deacetylase [Limnoglobus roseus]QEL15039.1 ChbG/HpnK family deacetylase [Limnoglobus roseus]